MNDGEVNSHDSMDSWSSTLDTTTLHGMQKEDSLAGTIKNPVALSSKKLNSPFFDKIELTEKQISRNQEKIKMFNTWRALRNEKSTLPIIPDERIKSDIWFLSTFGFLILFIPYLYLSVWAAFLIVIIALISLNIKELKIKTGILEVKSDELLKIEKRKNRLTTAALILGRIILSCLLLIAENRRFTKFFKGGLDQETNKYRPFKIP
jgi:heme exporter protein D